MPTYAKHSETDKKEAYEKADKVPIIQVRPAYVYKNDVIEHGGTGGCKACHAAMTRGNTTGYTHSPACRMRFENIFRERGSAKLTRADERWNQAVLEQSIGAMQLRPRRRRWRIRPQPHHLLKLGSRTSQ